MKNKSLLLTIIAIVIVIVIVIVIIIVVGLAAYYSQSGSNSTPNGAAPARSADLPETYVNDTYGFSFDYPAGLATSTFATADGNGQVILIADSLSGSGLQIVITPSNGPQLITAELIERDIPDITVLDPQPITVGGSGKGLSFLDGTSTAANFQVWFTADGFFYQITAPVGFKPTLEKILGTWQYIGRTSAKNL